LQSWFVEPCLPSAAHSPPNGADWVHETKHDGMRVMARNDEGRAQLYDRHGKDLTERFPRIVAAMEQLPCCMVDGEAIACDDAGLPSFELLQSGRRDDHVFLYAFDLIELEGKDCRRDQLVERKQALAALLAGAGAGVLPNQWVDGRECDGDTVFEYACAQGFEGIVSKRKYSRYVAGRSLHWVKVINPNSQAARRAAL
jgi:bifunctional non-homologous end joining protein LigD